MPVIFGSRLIVEMSVRLGPYPTLLQYAALLLELQPAMLMTAGRTKNNRNIRIKNRRMKPPRQNSPAATGGQYFRNSENLTTNPRSCGLASRNAQTLSVKGAGSLEQMAHREIITFDSPGAAFVIAASRLLRHVLFEPVESPLHDIAPVLRRSEAVSLIGIYHQLGRDVLGLERMPELKRLRRGTLPVAIANHDQRRRLDLADEIDRGTFVIGDGIFVNRRTEIGHHPLVDGILSVVALPVGDA